MFWHMQVEYADLQDVPAVILSEMQGRIRSRWAVCREHNPNDMALTRVSCSCRHPSWHLNSLSMRAGCIIMELDLAQLRNHDAESLSPPGDMDLVDWLNLVQLQDMAGASGIGSGNAISIKVSSHQS